MACRDLIREWGRDMIFHHSSINSQANTIPTQKGKPMARKLQIDLSCTAPQRYFCVQKTQKGYA
jgi:hypothetical protein